MASPVRRSLALALIGLLAGLGLVAAWFWGWEGLHRGIGRPDAEPPTAAAPSPDGGARTLSGPGPETGAPGGDPKAAGPDRQAAIPAPVSGASGSDTTPAGPAAPSFDIVRVEPNGDTVVAGRGAPNTVVEMLLDGKPVAKALADPDGQFAIVPPALPTGSSEIQLRTKAADGRETRSRQSVAVAVSERRDQKPLVALTAPDAATVVLSQPGAPEPAAKAVAKTADAKVPEIKPADGARAGGKAPVARIVSVDTQENGRLFVTGTGTPGASLRLYLNDTLIAPGSVGPDGTVTFTIGRGVKPGQYQVRIDQIEPGTGKVRSRAEVPFSMPEPAHSIASAGPREPSAGQGGAQAARTGGSATDPGPRAAAQDRPAVDENAPATPGRSPPDKGRPEPVDPRMAATAPAEPGIARPVPATSPEAGPARAGAVFVPEINTARISRGDNLWRISQRTYGRGERYTVIFDANQEQIRDPDLIYPGQIFVLPADKRG